VTFNVGRLVMLSLACLGIAACELLPSFSSEPTAAPSLVAPDAQGGSLTPEPTIDPGASAAGDAPDADAGMPTPEPTLDAPDADAGMPTPEPTLGPDH